MQAFRTRSSDYTPCSRFLLAVPKHSRTLLRAPEGDGGGRRRRKPSRPGLLPVPPLAINYVVSPEQNSEMVYFSLFLLCVRCGISARHPDSQKTGTAPSETAMCATTCDGDYHDIRHLIPPPPAAVGKTPSCLSLFTRGRQSNTLQASVDTVDRTNAFFRKVSRVRNILGRLRKTGRVLSTDS